MPDARGQGTDGASAWFFAAIAVMAMLGVAIAATAIFQAPVKDQSRIAEPATDAR